jgi:hypothetical protein
VLSLTAQLVNIKMRRLVVILMRLDKKSRRVDYRPTFLPLALASLVTGRISQFTCAGLGR